MHRAASEAGPRSLLGPIVRRSLRAGRVTLVVGIVWSLILGVSIGLSSGPAFVSTFPLILPIFGSLGALGALTVFTSDRMKGTLEYLLAYGVSPRTLLSNFIVACVTAVTLIVGVATAAGVGAYLGSGNSLTLSLALLLGLYSLPMSVVTASFATVVGMYWSALSSPREGMNSPIGLAPLLCIGPPVVTLVGISVLAAGGGVTALEVVAVLGSAVTVVTISVVALLASVGRLLRRERFLSTA